jgi:hypothetical protein
VGPVTRRTAGPPHRLSFGQNGPWLSPDDHFFYPGGTTRSGVNKAPSVHSCPEIASLHQIS